jgi:hypothetical protein
MSSVADKSASKFTAKRADQHETDIVFRPGYAVGLAYLRNPRGANEEAAEALRRALPGVDVRVDPRVDHLLLKLPESTLRQVNEYAGQNLMARHEALVMLIKAGLAAADMAERVYVYRKAALEGDIADALVPIRAARKDASTQRALLGR